MAEAWADSSPSCLSQPCPHSRGRTAWGQHSERQCRARACGTGATSRARRRPRQEEVSSVSSSVFLSGPPWGVCVPKVGSTWK